MVTLEAAGVRNSRFVVVFVVGMMHCLSQSTQCFNHTKSQFGFIQQLAVFLEKSMHADGCKLWQPVHRGSRCAWPWKHSMVSFGTNGGGYWYSKPDLTILSDPIAKSMLCLWEREFTASSERYDSWTLNLIGIWVYFYTAIQGWCFWRYYKKLIHLRCIGLNINNLFKTWW